MIAVMRFRNAPQEGQALMLMVMSVVLIATAIGMFAIEHARHAHREAIEYKRAVDVTYALNGTARWLHQIYYHEANCDPYVFNNRINETSKRLHRSRFSTQTLSMDSNAVNMYDLSVANISPAPPAPSNVGGPIGTAGGSAPAPYSVQGMGPQDMTVTFWVTPYGQMGYRGATRYEQTITLINTCSPRAPDPSNTSVQQFKTISNPASFAADVALAVNGTDTTAAVCGTRARGSVDSGDSLDYQDHETLLNYTKNADATGVTTTCRDTNFDGVTNEVDLNVIDKTLKGYLYYHVPSAQEPNP